MKGSVVAQQKRITAIGDARRLVTEEDNGDRFPARGRRRGPWLTSWKPFASQADPEPRVMQHVWLNLDPGLSWLIIGAVLAVGSTLSFYRSSMALSLR